MTAVNAADILERQTKTETGGGEKEERPVKQLFGGVEENID